MSEANSNPVAAVSLSGRKIPERVGVRESTTTGASIHRVIHMIVDIYRLAYGKIAEQWATLDALGMMQQFGAIPTPGALAR